MRSTIKTFTVIGYGKNTKGEFLVGTLTGNPGKIKVYYERSNPKRIPFDFGGRIPKIGERLQVDTSHKYWR